MLASYDTYIYMKKRWEKYIRKQGTEDVSWETVLHRIVLFLRPPGMQCAEMRFSLETGCRIWNDIYKRLPTAAFISGFIVCPDIPGGM